MVPLLPIGDTRSDQRPNIRRHGLATFTSYRNNVKQGTHEGTISKNAPNTYPLIENELTMVHYHMGNVHTYSLCLQPVVSSSGIGSGDVKTWE